MNKHSVLKELGSVLRQSSAPASVSKLESGPAPLSPRLQYETSNAPAPSAQSSSLLSSLLPGLTGRGSTGSLFAGLLGAATGGIGAAPLIAGLTSLFGGGKSAPAALNLYSAPQRVNLQAGIHNGTVGAADYGQSGTPRSSQPAITLHVQAMDSKSILDRSSDIAQAVRQAMLQSHPINDVVADL